MSFKGTPSKAGRKRSVDQISAPNTPNSTTSASSVTPNKQRKSTPSEFTVLYFNAVAIALMAVNAYPQ